ncbi:MAG: glycoside hydrolase family 16 protein [Bacteroidales bacterium]|nr:glycoside hydrolase family 16 protein [Bacteroidales bacterium]
MNKITLIPLLFFFSEGLFAQNAYPFVPDFNSPVFITGMTLVWNDEFNNEGKPDPSFWRYETGFVRNQELQWYQAENANCTGGVLVIEGRKEKIKNPDFVTGSTNWKANREYAEYTSASIQTRGLKQWQFGRFEIRARIDTSHGSWPAIWTLGISGGWPSGGEIDIMEFYRIKDVPTILANFAWGTEKRFVAKWDDLKKPLTDFTADDPDWTRKFHIWKMDWDKDSIRLYLDNQLLNFVLVRESVNPDGFNPFLQPHYLLMNLAIGANGGDPSKSSFPLRYEIDWVRIYQKKQD